MQISCKFRLEKCKYIEYVFQKMNVIKCSLNTLELSIGAFEKPT